jgi:hypothetical protein
MVTLYVLVFGAAERKPSRVPAAVRLGQPERA